MFAYLLSRIRAFSLADNVIWRILSHRYCSRNRRQGRRIRQSGRATLLIFRSDICSTTLNTSNSSVFASANCAPSVRREHEDSQNNPQLNAVRNCLSYSPHLFSGLQNSLVAPYYPCRNNSVSNTYVFESMTGFEKVFLRRRVFTPEECNVNRIAMRLISALQRSAMWCVTWEHAIILNGIILSASNTF